MTTEARAPRTAPRCPRGSTLEERLLILSRIDPATGCRLWVAHLDDKGYPRMTVRHPSGGFSSGYGHRVAYEVWVEPIPTGMTVDHLCFTPACINPKHLRLLSRRANASNQRSKYKERCVNGHAFNLANTGLYADGKRWCRACKKIRNRRRYLENRMAAAS